MGSIKLERISSSILRELSSIIYEEVHNDVIRSVTITDARVTNDLSLCKVYYTFYGNYEKNEVQKNNKAIYLDNGTNSVSIEIKMIDNDTIYQMETIYNKGIQNFINYYGNIKFKCVEIKYHNSTNKVKYMLFEQITE